MSGENFAQSIQCINISSGESITYQERDRLDKPMKTHTEQAFETAIEHHLLNHGYTEARPETFDPVRCIDPGTVLAFIQKTQPKEWEYLKNIQKDRAEETLLADLAKALDSTCLLYTSDAADE